MKSGHKVLSSTWNESTKKWYVSCDISASQNEAHTAELYARKVTGVKLPSGETFEEDDIDFVISARGTLNEAAWPSIPGLNDFKGKLLHSSKWDDSWVFFKRQLNI